MRISIQFSSDKDIALPLHYNYMIQSFIYSNIDEKLSRFLHEKGFIDGKRKFKGFAFSRLLSSGRKVLSNRKEIFVKPPFVLVVASPVDIFIESLAEKILKRNNLSLNQNKVYVESINVHVLPKFENSVTAKMLSPITVYSTLNKPDGGKKTYYYSPLEREFSELIVANLLKKHRAYYRKNLNGSLVVEPARVSNRDEKIIFYKGTVIKGWMGTYKLKGSPELIRLAYDSGIGSKNSQGFGCFKIT